MTEGDIHLMERDYEYSIEDFCQYVHNQSHYDECCRGGWRIKYVWSELGSSLQGTYWAGHCLVANSHNSHNKFALLWGEAQLCLPYVCF